MAPGGCGGALRAAVACQTRCPLQPQGVLQQAVGCCGFIAALCLRLLASIRPRLRVWVLACCYVLAGCSPRALSAGSLLV